MNRPSGLTALAVLNFVVAFLYLIVGVSTLLALTGAAPPQEGRVQPPETILAVTSAFAFLDVALLITAGVGYLKLKRILGRYLGSVEALLGLCFFGFLTGYALNEGAPLQFSSLNHLVYPGITLVLLNVVFRENLTL
jgi:hypothetical protein